MKSSTVGCFGAATQRWNRMIDLRPAGIANRMSMPRASSGSPAERARGRHRCRSRSRAILLSLLQSQTHGWAPSVAGRVAGHDGHSCFHSEGPRWLLSAKAAVSADMRNPSRVTPCGLRVCIAAPGEVVPDFERPADEKLGADRHVRA